MMVSARRQSKGEEKYGFVHLLCAGHYIGLFVHPLPSSQDFCYAQDLGATRMLIKLVSRFCTPAQVSLLHSFLSPPL